MMTELATRRVTPASADMDAFVKAVEGARISAGVVSATVAEIVIILHEGGWTGFNDTDVKAAIAVLASRGKDGWSRPKT